MKEGQSIFNQTDWDFKLDQMTSATFQELSAHLDCANGDEQQVEFLRDHLNEEWRSFDDRR
jgi:hypothetical protein